MNSLSENTYEGTRRVVYEGGATFVPVCEQCGRYVKPDETVCDADTIGPRNGPNATCSKCGRTRMLFEGFLL